MLLTLLFLGSANAAPPVVSVADTHDGAGWAVHQLAVDREKRLSRIKRPDTAAEIAADMRQAMVPKAAVPRPMVASATAPVFDDDEDDVLCLLF